jgi:hypothetical protein
VAGGSNRFFEQLASWARAAVVQLRADDGDQATFAAAVAVEARQLMASLAGRPLLDDRPTLVTAARVAAWTWNTFRAPKRKENLSAEDIAKRESDGARQTATKRRAKTRAIIIATATELQAQTGKMPTQVAVLAAVQTSGIRTAKTVRSYWPDVKLALDQTGSWPSPYVKKHLVEAANAGQNQLAEVDAPDVDEHLGIAAPATNLSPAKSAQNPRPKIEPEDGRDGSIGAMSVGSSRLAWMTGHPEESSGHGSFNSSRIRLGGGDVEATAGPGVPCVRPQWAGRGSIGSLVQGGYP